MPAKNPKLLIKLDLLRPQSSPEKIPAKFLKWLISSGRYIFILVEAVVLIAFIIRFKLDADIANNKEAIEAEIPFIQSLKSYEILIRQTQLKISTIKSFHVDIPNYPQILKRIAEQTPLGVTITSLKLEKGVGKIIILINAKAQNNSDVSNFIAGLKEDGYFPEVTLVSIGLEQGVLHFVINAESQAQSQQLKNL